MSEEIKEFSFENEEYRQTYWHTCSHIMAQAVKRLWPEVKLAIGPYQGGLVLRYGCTLCLYPGAHDRDRGRDAEDLQGEAEAGAL